MPVAWSIEKRKKIKEELYFLYWDKKLTIPEIAKLLKIHEKSLYQRFRRLRIPSDPTRKITVYGRKKISLPKYSVELAEFVGIMLGDGSISKFQSRVTLGNKENTYADYVSNLFLKVFEVPLRKIITKEGYVILYVSSIDIVHFFLAMGFAPHKVRSQVGMPKWISENDGYKKSFLRGFFDTDGSIYKLKFGWQISFCNRSLVLLHDIRQILIELKYSPSEISGFNLYLTRRDNLLKFRQDIGSFNVSKKNRLNMISRVGTQVVNESAL